MYRVLEKDLDKTKWGGKIKIELNGCKDVKTEVVHKRRPQSGEGVCPVRTSEEGVL